MNLHQMRAFLANEFPANHCIVEEAGAGTSKLQHPIGHEHLRLGETVSGPTLMMIADCAIYVAILGKLGEVTLTVTANLNIHFLRKPVADKDIIAESKLLKVGKRLVIGEVFIYFAGMDIPVAHATATYSIPPQQT